MKIQYKEIDIALKDRATIVRKRVPTWEVPVIEAVHGVGGVDNVTLVRDVVEERPSLSSQEEYSRLDTVYGADGEGTPFVAAVYGQHGMGVAALKRAMIESVLSDDAEVTPPDAVPQLRADVTAAIKPDVVAGLEQERQLAQARRADAAAAELIS